MEANIVSPVVVIIVALTALGSLVIPNEEFASAFRLLKYFFSFPWRLSWDLRDRPWNLSYSGASSGLLSYGFPILSPLCQRREGGTQEIKYCGFLSEKENETLGEVREEESLRLKRKEEQS